MSSKVPRGGGREAIVNAAAEVFAERGYDGARVQEIARRAGVTTGAIYAHFSGRHDLLVATIERYAGTVAQQQLAEFDFSRHSAADAIVMIGAALARNPDLGMRPLAIEALVAARREPELADLMRNQVELANAQVEALVAQGKADGSIAPEVDAAAVAKWANAILVGVAMLAPVWESPIDPLGWEDLLSRLVSGLVPGGAGPQG
jgi:AcrR family transcriptional regulator